MEFIIAEDYEGMSRAAADVVAGVMADDPSCVLGLATGSTPIGMYACLADDCAQGKISFKDVTTFNLDEYVGLPGTHDQSYRYFMDENLFNKVDVNKTSTHLPDGCAGNLDQMCAEYEAQIQQAGGVDIQVLGTTATSASMSRAKIFRWQRIRWISRRAPSTPTAVCSMTWRMSPAVRSPWA